MYSFKEEFSRANNPFAVGKNEKKIRTHLKPFLLNRKFSRPHAKFFFRFTVYIVNINTEDYHGRNLICFYD